MGVHAILFEGGSERGEVDVRRDVLFPGSFIWIGAGGVLAVGHDRAPVAAGEELVAGVAVIDGEKKTARDQAGHSRRRLLSEQGRFDALSRFGMDAVVIEIFQLALRGRPPGFEKVAAAKGDAQHAFSTDDFY